MAKDLEDFFHELSRLHDVPKVVYNDHLTNGHICGSDRASLRIASALALLQLQRDGNLDSVEIIYVDDHLTHSKRLVGGAVLQY